MAEAEWCSREERGDAGALGPLFTGTPPPPYAQSYELVGILKIAGKF